MAGRKHVHRDAARRAAARRRASDETPVADLPRRRRSSAGARAVDVVRRIDEAIATDPGSAGKA